MKPRMGWEPASSHPVGKNVNRLVSTAPAKARQREREGKEADVMVTVIVERRYGHATIRSRVSAHHRTGAAAVWRGRPRRLPSDPEGFFAAQRRIGR